MDKESEKSEKRTKTGEIQSESARRDSAEGEGGRKQQHENRVNPEKDHVPGHMGYDRSNLDSVLTTPNKNGPQK